MITQALQHCYGVGPIRMQKLQELGLNDWYDVISKVNDFELEANLKERLIKESQRCIEALESANIDYFTNSFESSDQWRIMAEYFNEISYVDIETSGLGWDDYTTMICAFHKGEVHYFYEHENLDDFLDLVDDMKLMMTFNGSSFDVPRIISTFHIPELPCAHIDLRWICYHKNLRGGLKRISHRMGIRRPYDIETVNGDEAIYLWEDWTHLRDHQALNLLKRYCAADVLLLYLVATEILQDEEIHINSPYSQEELWAMLPT